MIQRLYRISKEIRFEAAHQLAGLPPEHMCSRLHGHNYRVEFILSGLRLDPKTGMLLDFTIFNHLKMQLDHQFLNDVMKPINPTAENIAAWFCDATNQILLELDAHEEVFVDRVRVWETDTCWAEVERREVP